MRTRRRKRRGRKRRKRKRRRTMYLQTSLQDFVCDENEMQEEEEEDHVPADIPAGPCWR